MRIHILHWERADCAKRHFTTTVNKALQSKVVPKKRRTFISFEILADGSWLTVRNQSSDNNCEPHFSSILMLKFQIFEKLTFNNPLAVGLFSTSISSVRSKKSRNTGDSRSGC